jgi:hypothetical protein
MKIIHLTVVRHLPGGIKKQLYCERDASKSLSGADWTTMVWQDEEGDGVLVNQIPFFFRHIFLRNIFAWFLILKLSRRCDYLLVRHIPFDPLSFLFSMFVSNRVTVHHTKEIEEMRIVGEGWKGVCASALESVAGKFLLRRNVGILAVTDEIGQYERARAKNLPEPGVYANGIDVESVDILDDARQEGCFNVAFICTSFSSWHGLEKLIETILSDQSAVVSSRVRIHLIGELSAHQSERIKASRVLSEIFVCHGLLAVEGYRKVMSICDVGLGSLALELKGLSEASTLKVREMLAMGLPVVSGHKDSSIPDGFSYYRIYPDGLLDFSEIIGLFGGGAYSREEVRSASLPFIRKVDQMQSVVSYLARIKSE